MADETRTPQDAALLKMFQGYQELKALGWNDIIHCPKDGTHFDAIEVGSVGVHDCAYEGVWPKGSWWLYDGDIWPSRPVLFRLKEKADV